MKKLKTWIFRRWLDFKYPGVFDWGPLPEPQRKRLADLAERRRLKSK